MATNTRAGIRPDRPMNTTITTPCRSFVSLEIPIGNEKETRGNETGNEAVSTYETKETAPPPTRKRGRVKIGLSFP